MSYWMVRASNHKEISYPLLNGNKKYISIGFVDLVDLDIDNSKEFENINELKSVINDRWGDKKRGITIHGSYAANLWMFCKEIKKGDVVLVPMPGTFSIYRINSNCLKAGDLHIDQKIKGLENLIVMDNKMKDKENNTEYDLGFFYEVEKICDDCENKSRYDFLGSFLTSRLKYRGTVARLDDLRISVDEVINRLESSQKIKFHENIRKPTLESIQRDLNDKKFELLVKNYFINAGAKTDIRAPRPEQKEEGGDADVVAYFPNIHLMIVVQVKYYVGTSHDKNAIDQVSGSKQYESNDNEYDCLYWVISSCDEFSEDVIQYANEKKCRLIKGIDFVQMLLDVGMKDIDL